MSRTWKLIECFVLLLSLVAAVAVVGVASAQSQEQSRDDDQQSSSQSNRVSDDSSSRDRNDRDEAHDRDRDQSRDSDRDADRSDSRRNEQSEIRSRSYSRDQYRGAPRLYNRQSSEENRSDEQGGLGVAVEDAEQGVLVTEVYSDTPAEEMGLRRGDRITQVDGREIESARDFISRIRNMEPGKEVELDILRNRDERSISGELESRNEALRLRNRQSSGRQFEYGDSRAETYSSAPSGREGDVLNRLYAIERQLDQLRRELQQLKSSLEQRGGNRESSVTYYEEPVRRSGERFSTRQSQFEDSSPQFDSRRGSWNRPDEDRSPGGVTGEGRRASQLVSRMINH